jgi:hypothetical protein
MAVPLTTGNEDAIAGMWLCSQQMSTTPEQLCTRRLASYCS